MSLQGRSSIDRKASGHIRTASKANSDVASIVSSVPPPPPRLVQSMLRNTTELGELGFFSAGSNHLLHKISHQRELRRPLSLATSLRSDPHYRSSSRHPQHRSFRPSFQHRNPINMVARMHEEPVPPQKDLRDYRTHRRPQPSPPIMSERSTQNLRGNNYHSQRSLSTFRSLDEMRSRQSLSTYAYTPFAERRVHKRTGHRDPSSIYQPTSLRHPLDNQSRISMASSSASMIHPYPYLPTRSYPHPSWSSASLIKSSVQQRRDDSRSGHQDGYGYLTRQVSIPSVAYGSGRISEKNLVTAGSIPPSPPPSAGLYYYDYSEPFTDESFRVDFEPSLQSVLPQIGLKEELEVGNADASSPARMIAVSRLPARHSRNTSKHSVSNAPAPVPQRNSSLDFAIRTASISRSDTPADARETSKAAAMSDNSDKKIITLRKRGPEEHENDSRVLHTIDTIQNETDPKCSHMVPLHVREARCNRHCAAKDGSITSKIETEPGCGELDECSFGISCAEAFCPLRQSPSDVLDEKELEQHVKSNGFLQHMKSAADDVGPFHVLGPVSSNLAADQSEGREDGVVPMAIGQPATTPTTDTRVGMMPSHGKSTIESLLDKHIESLGICPELESPLKHPPALSASSRSMGASDESTIKDTHGLTYQCTEHGEMNGLEDNSDHAMLEDQPYNSLMPRRLFAPQASILYGKGTDHNLKGSLIAEGNNNRPSYGWQTLASTSNGTLTRSQHESPHSTGNLADIDSSLGDRRFKIRRRSAPSLSHQSTNAPSLDSLVPHRSEFTHKRSRSELVARQESHRRRRLRIRLKLERFPRTVSDPSIAELAAESGRANGRAWTLPTPILPQTAEKGIVQTVDGETQPPLSPLQDLNICEMGSSSTPHRWANVTPAVAKIESNKASMLRHGSVRTAQSYRSEQSLAEPINSARLALQALKPADTTPILAAPDLGPPLVVSEWNLSIPYAPEPSTIRPSFPDTRSFFEESPVRQIPRGVRKLFGLASLRSLLSGSSGLAAYSDKDAASPGHRNLSDWGILEDVYHQPRDELLAKRNGMMTRVRSWWRNHCLQKHLSTKHRKNVVRPPAGMIV